MPLEPHPVDHRQSEFDCGPVTGGMRWRRDAFSDFCRRTQDRPNEDAEEESLDDAPPEPAPRAVPARGPFMTFTPPTEARVGEEYVVRATAFDPYVNGFNWFFKKDRRPQNMTLDRYTGELRWTPSEVGYYEVTLGCGTVHGAMAEITWTIRVGKAAAIRAVTPSPRFQSAVRRKNTLIRAPRPPCRAWRRPRRHTDPSSRALAPPGVARSVAFALRI